MEQEIIDYSEKSFTKTFENQGCKYAVSFTEEYYGFEDGIGPTGRFIVVANASRGTHICYFRLDRKSSDWMPEDTMFLHLVPLEYFHFIQDELKLISQA